MRTGEKRSMYFEVSGEHARRWFLPALWVAHGIHVARDEDKEAAAAGVLVYTLPGGPNEVAKCRVEEGLTTKVRISGQQSYSGGRDPYESLETLCRRCGLVRSLVPVPVEEKMGLRIVPKQKAA